MSLLSADIPVLETERLILRGWREDDLDGYASIFSDAEFSRFIGGPQDRTWCWFKMAACAGHWLMRGWGPFVMEEKSSGAFAGYCGPWDPVGKADEPEISYALAPGFVGKGLAVEGVRRALEFAFSNLKWKTACSYIDKDNEASLALAQKLGATFECDTTIYSGQHEVQIWRYPSPVKAAA